MENTPFRTHTPSWKNSEGSQRHFSVFPKLISTAAKMRIWSGEQVLAQINISVIFSVDSLAEQRSGRKL